MKAGGENIALQAKISIYTVTQIVCRLPFENYLQLCNQQVEIVQTVSDLSCETVQYPLLLSRHLSVKRETQ